MKLSLLAFASLLALPMFAHAEMDVASCSNKNQSVVVLIATDFQGTYAQVAEKNEMPASGVIRVVKGAPNAQMNAAVKLSGKVNQSAKGPYFELKGEGVELLISAAASKSPSELTIGGKKIEIDCE